MSWVSCATLTNYTWNQCESSIVIFESSLDHEKARNYEKDKNIKSILLTDDELLLLRVTLKAHFQDDSKQYQPLFENKADHRSIISKNRVFAYFGILAFFRNKFGSRKSVKNEKRQKQIG